MKSYVKIESETKMNEDIKETLSGKLSGIDEIVEKRREEMENDRNKFNIPNIDSVSTVQCSGADNLPNGNVENSVEQNDIEEEEPPVVKSKSRNRTLRIIDSDSEEEAISIAHGKKSSPKSEANELHSDSETEDTSLNKSANKKSRRIAIIHSDSDEEVDPTIPDPVESTIPVDSTKEGDSDLQNSKVFLVDYKGGLIEENQMQSKHQNKILSNLCDSESSDEESNRNTDDCGEEEGENISDNELSALQSNVIISKSRKKQTKKAISEDKKEKMTAKKALEQRKEILAESQRRVRESRVSLPYHKPKLRSLREFLENRSKLASPLQSVPQGTSPSVAIKMTVEELQVVTQKLKEREKEVEEFYKSESEPEDDESQVRMNDVEMEDRNQKEDSPNDKPADTVPNNSQIEIQDSGSVEMNSEETDAQSKEIVNNAMELTQDTDSLELIHEGNTNGKDMFGMEQQKDDVENMIQNDAEKLIEEQNENMIVEEINDDIEVAQGNVDNFNSIIENETTSEVHDKNRENLNEGENDEITLSNHIANEENFSDTVNLSFPEKVLSDVENTTDCNEKDYSKISDKPLILSDVVLKPAESEKPENFYDLDSENPNEDEYQFNLDDIEEESEQHEGNNVKVDESQKKKFNISEKLAELKPRLSGGPNQVIDLETGVTMADEVSKLRERFLQHNMKVGKQGHKKNISILRVSDGNIHKEMVALNVEEDDAENTAPIEKPGVRLQKLRVELQNRMSQRRSELWKEKLDKSSKTEDGIDDENDGNKSDFEKDLLDDDEEEEMTESEVEDEEEELIENDVDISEKKVKKSAFVDEEAQESDIEEDYDNVPINDDEDHDEIPDLNEENDEAIVGDEDEDEEESQDKTPKKRILRRIIKPFNMDDSDSDDELYTQDKTNYELAFKKREKGPDSDDDFLLPHQPTNYRTKTSVTPVKSTQDFLTPVTFMTGLQNLNTSGSRKIMPMDFSPDKQSTHNSSGGDIDFQASDDISSTQEIPLESTKEDSSQSKYESSFKLDSAESNTISTQEALEICSGPFASTGKSTSSPEISTQNLKDIFDNGSDFNTQEMAGICSGKFTGITQSGDAQEKGSALDENDEHIISQLIDEEELESFKKKFESPLPTATQKIINFEEAEEVKASGGVIDSDDDDGNVLQLKKRRSKKLTFSDDEDSSEEEPTQEETIDLEDRDDVNSDLEYDSEENEIDHNGEDWKNEEKKREIVKASEFFENEAELSESEWGSEDEDERNLDALEEEKGDQENFDDDQLRSDIERIQMKQMLDDDNREVKLLQELLLEDGELHGSGRQRQFRWKNIDSAGNEIEERNDDDGDVYFEEEDENEEKRRKMRHEREMFMLKKESQEEEECVIVASQRLSFTNKTLKIKSQSSAVSQTFSTDKVSNSPEVKRPLSLLNKRGSFLSRSEKILQKLAETSQQVNIGAKNTNRIVFQTVGDEPKKRKVIHSGGDQLTPVALKKIRLSGINPTL